MGEKTTKSSDSSNKKELGVVEASEKEIKARKDASGYDTAVFGYIDFNVNDRAITQDGENVGSATDDTSSSNKGTYVQAGNSLIVKFKDKIQEIFNGVKLSVKDSKEKSTKHKAKKSAEKEDKEDKEKEENENKVKKTSSTPGVKKKVVKKSSIDKNEKGRE